MRKIPFTILLLLASLGTFAQQTGKTYAETQREKANADYNKAYLEGLKYNRNTPSKSTPEGDNKEAEKFAEQVKKNSANSDKARAANSKYYEDMKKSVKTEREARLADATRLIERKQDNYETLVAVAMKCGYSYEEATQLYKDIDSDRIDINDGSNKSSATGNHKILFNDVNSAKANYKWQRLETPKDNESIYRYITDNKLYYEHKSDKYSWATTNLSVPDLANWSYSGNLTITKTTNKAVGTGLVMVAKNPGEAKNYIIMFMVNPEDRSYWFGTFNYNNNEWKTLNKYAGTTYEVSHPIINEFSRRKGAANELSITKSGNALTLFINQKKVEVITVNSHPILNNIYGVGIATNQKSEGFIENLAFTVN